MKLFTETDIRLHQYCQTIAKANRTFVAKQSDDSHTNLYFDEIGDRICGRWIEKTPLEYIFTYNLSNQKIEVLSKALQVVLSVECIGGKISEIEEEIAHQLPNLGLDPTGFQEDLHFEIPDYDFKNKPVVKIDNDGLILWKNFRKIANSACNLLLDHLQISAEVRIWPHHFDTGIYVVPNDSFGLGFGLAMEDSMAGAPYFYMAAYPSEGNITYVNLPTSEHWEWKVSENWNGVILTLDELEKHSEENQKAIIQEYILQNVHWFLSNEN